MVSLKNSLEWVLAAARTYDPFLGWSILNRARTFEFILHFVKRGTVALPPTQIIIIIMELSAISAFHLKIKIALVSE